MTSNWLAFQAQSRPHAPAARENDRAVAYGELGRRVARLAAAFQRRGIQFGDRVALRLPTDLDHLEALHALWWLGAVPVPLHERATPEELQRQLSILAVSRLICRSHDELRVGPPPLLLDKVLATLPTDMARPAVTTRWDHALILFTSGSSGPPKPVPLTYGNLLASATASAFHLGIDRRDTWYCCLPLSHVGGLMILVRSVLYGTSVHLSSSFDPAACATLATRGGMSLISVVPTMLRRLLPLLAAPGRSGRLRTVLVGGGPADPELMAQASRLQFSVLQTYGMTETCSQVATMAPEDAAQRIGSVGRPLFGAEVEIRRPSLQPAVPGEKGSIWVRGAMVTQGYLDDTEENRRRFEAGWFDTQDFGLVDENGFLFIEGRRDDLIITGGENVAPDEIEAVLRQHPAVEDCAVVGLPDAEWGEVVAAAIVAKDAEKPPSFDELATFCRRQLAGFKIPRRWARLTQLVRTESGKVQRRQLADHWPRSPLPADSGDSY